jgi:hypothetical protein
VVTTIGHHIKREGVRCLQFSSTWSRIDSKREEEIKELKNKGPIKEVKEVGMGPIREVKEVGMGLRQRRKRWV